MMSYDNFFYTPTEANEEDWAELEGGVDPYNCARVIPILTSTRMHYRYERDEEGPVTEETLEYDVETAPEVVTKFECWDADWSWGPWSDFNRFALGIGGV
jgi:hypothetical protein